MMLIAALLLQATQPAPALAATAQPDIQLDVRATARRVVIHNEGEVDLTLRTSVNGREGEGNVIEVDAPDLPEGRRELNNVEVRVRAEARIPAPQNGTDQQEPGSPQ
jgi:hypothetical protein